jgi:hypothetical protein
MSDDIHEPAEGEQRFAAMRFRSPVVNYAANEVTLSLQLFVDEE